jgi:predicted metalloprotease with PDZ domain
MGPFVKTIALAMAAAVTPPAVQAESAIVYELRYGESAAGVVTITITLPESTRAPIPLIIPRTYPGGYQQVPYDAFVGDVAASAPDGKSLQVVKDPDGPRWNLGQYGDTLQRISYSVNIRAMEAQIRDASSTSKARQGYVGLLGYSVFGYLDGLADQRVVLHVQGPQGWPVISTLNPAVPARQTNTSSSAPDYYELADSEVLMGPAIRLARIDGRIPLVMAVYSEGRVDMDEESRLAREALDDVQQYFGDTPISQYTVQLELLHPIPGHDYNFSQEHTDSGTFTFSADGAVTAESTAELIRRERFNYAHHMAHSWIPKRAYGVGYRPFTWEMTPVTDTIWFNEGFGRYAAIAAIAAAMPQAAGGEFREQQLAALRRTVDGAAPFLRRMSLPLLSREASFLYSDDFRTGRNIYSRGALMAAEMDDRIRSASQGKKSLRDALRWLLRWSAENRKPFQTEDFAGYLAAATGVDVSDILERWMKPLEPPDSARPARTK